MNLIEHIIEPKRLYLYWQSPEYHRHKVAEMNRDAISGDINLVYLVNTDEYSKAIEKGFTGYPAYPIDKDKYSDVLDIFMRRLPPRSRMDFGEYLTALRLPNNVKISDFALLGYAGAKLPSDDFLLIHPFEDITLPCEILVHVAGFRHYNEARGMLNKEIVEGVDVQVKDEPDNQFDSQAIAVYIKNIKIGNITRGIIPSFREWMHKGLIHKLVVERINGTSENPELYLFLKLSLKEYY